MKATCIFVGLVLLAIASAQQYEEPRPKGVIYGIAVGQDGQPATRVGLSAYQLGVGIAGRLPHAKTNDAGEYRFENLHWGRYTVYADDEEAGYSIFSTSPNLDDGHAAEVELAPQHPEAEFRVNLPPKAGFLHVHLTNRRTGAGISAMRIALMSTENPVSPVFTMSCYSNQVVLIPPDKHLLLHVTSDGFHEWEESVGTGRPIQMRSGTRLTLELQLEPLKNE